MTGGKLLDGGLQGSPGEEQTVADGQENPSQQPGSAEQQIDAEITMGKAVGAIVGALGGEYHHQSGGGGAGEYYEYTSLADLDAIITRATAVRDTIQSDGLKFVRVLDLIKPPAADVMSVMQANATRVSVEAGYEHNRAMLREAEAALSKLAASRKLYADVEDRNTLKMKNQHKG